jgi:TolB protein
MKVSLLVLLCLFSFSSLAQDDGKVSIIAVGEAQDEKERLLIGKISVSGSLSEPLQRSLKEIESLIKNDLAFYKHRLETIEIEASLMKPDWENHLDKRFQVGLTAKAKGAGLEVSAEIWDSLKKESIGRESIQASGTGLRDQGHKLSDWIYTKITGKKSIFLSKIIFVSDRTSKGKDTKKELYSMDFDGRRVERLTFFNSTVISPSVSPDNKNIIFSVIQSHVQTDRKNKSTKNIDLMIYNRDSKKSVTVSGHPGINSGAVYSADGKSIYFTLSKSGNADIYEMDLATKNLRQVTNHYAEDVDPTVTADGSYMSFLSNRAGKAHIYVMDPRGVEKDVRRISFVGLFNAAPRFSPDGRSIVFTSWVDQGFDLYRIDSQGNNLARLTKNFGSNEEPWWSPDGEFVIFTSQRVINRSKALQDIYIMNRDGEIVGQLTQDFGLCFSPRWTN